MQNDFEKQVQQKLEELNLAPSEPVWTNIEKEINKKDKRRFFIWLPILLVFLGGGVYWYYSLQNRGIIRSEIDSNNHTKNTISNITPTNSAKNSSDKNIETPKEIQKKNEDLNSIISRSNISESYIAKQKYYSTINSGKKIKVLHKIEIGKNIVDLNENEEDRNTMPNSRGNEERIQENQFLPEHLLQIPVFNFLLDASEHTIADGAEKKVVHLQKYKWKRGVEFSVGLSNLSSGQESINKSYANYTPGNITSSNAIIQSPYTRNISFSAGLNFTKKLSKQVEFQTGIIYEYFSFNILVGQYVKQDTVVKNNSVDQFYRNTAFSSSMQATISNHNNKLHFLGIPLKLHVTPFRKLPIKLSAGLMVQELIHSDMLIYDEGSGVYYSSNKSLNKFLISSTAGVEYAFPFLKHSFTVGPYFNYGLSNTIKYKAGALYNLNFRVSMDLKK